ncbi:uncharacterized protein N7477_006436 [Penicillium maclennaniae]|uniref:uncharacterized protein n=1 Tax=Penicillium maclennaniae TaxID=1343394 RepID=UPI002540AA16|nr:uncharacterized protein N7477_006436 [Penicillium maclennaniae]KAJ5667866.1 hypothetical protein N7477_006436 [Penicillium maclennaniae]
MHRGQRKLAGSVIQISRMTDVRYVKRQRSTYSKQKMDRLDAYCLPMGERHLHAVFAEGIMAGRPQRNSLPVITPEIPKNSTNSVGNAASMNNVRFSHYWQQEPWHQENRIENSARNNSIRKSSIESRPTDKAQAIVWVEWT